MVTISERAQLEGGPSRQTDIAYEALQTQITVCRLSPGSEVTEAGLAESLGFGRASIRAALLRLAQDGLVQPIPRRGYRIAPITLKDVFEVFDLRAILEGEAAKVATGKINEEALVLAHERWVESAERSCNNVDRESLLANKKFHMLIAECTENSRFIMTLSKLFDETERLLSIGLPLAMAHAEIQEGHQPIIDALVKGPPSVAEAAAVAHVKKAKAIVLEALMVGTNLKSAEIQNIRAPAP